MNQSLKVLLKKIRNSFFVFLLFITPFVQGQVLTNVSFQKEDISINQKPYKIISFGDNINFGKIENSVVWSILNIDLNTKTSLNGIEINNYIFETPGTFQITFNENKLIVFGECNHAIFPELMIIKVSPFKMDFDFSTIKFNKKLESGAPIENCQLTVDVYLKSIANEKVVFPNGKVVSAGIDTTIEGQLLGNAVTLFPGVNKLVYQLKGAAKAGNFIMLDFFDVNGQVQSYYYPTKL